MTSTYRPYSTTNTRKSPVRYESDLDDQEHELIASELAQKPGPGRKRTVNIREIVNAIFYLLRTGCQWLMLPKDFPDYRHVWYYFNKWTLDGTWERINDILRRRVRVSSGKDAEPSAAILDSQSVKTTEVGGEDGYDAHKKVNGRKRHILVDTLGLLLEAVVSAASVQDSDGGEILLDSIKDKLPRLEKVWVDQGYKQWLIDLVNESFSFVLETVKRPEGQKGFQVIPQRWKVERTVAWLNRNRRLSKACPGRHRDYEYHTENSESMVYLASIRLMLRRLANAGT